MNAPTKAQIKFVRSLQSRKVRDESNLFVAEGPKVVAELLAAPNLQVQDIFATTEWIIRNSHQISAAGGAIIETDDQTLSRMTSLAGPNQVIAVFSKPLFDLTSASSNPHVEASFTIVLDGVQDPGNVGTIVRCADWFGISQIICGPGCADVFNAKVVQSTMGSIARVQVDYLQNLNEYFDGLPPDMPVLAAILDGESLHDIKSPGHGHLIIGSESHGIRPDLQARATQKLTIPRRGQAESLNAGVAAGILLAWLTN